jgi:hypothetical protein
MPLLDLSAQCLGRVRTLPVPHDCSDAVLHAWWRRLADDLGGGAWQHRHGHLKGSTASMSAFGW